MAVQKPDELQHNNPALALIDSDFTRGGRRAVPDRTALYALIDHADQLKENVTVVRILVDSEAEGATTEVLLINAAQIDSAAGWEPHNTGTGTPGESLPPLNEPGSSTTRSISQDAATKIGLTVLQQIAYPAWYQGMSVRAGFRRAYGIGVYEYAADADDVQQTPDVDPNATLVFSWVELTHTFQKLYFIGDSDAATQAASIESDGNGGLIIARGVRVLFDAIYHQSNLKLKSDGELLLEGARGVRQEGITQAQREALTNVPNGTRVYQKDGAKGYYTAEDGAWAKDGSNSPTLELGIQYGGPYVLDTTNGFQTKQDWAYGYQGKFWQSTNQGLYKTAPAAGPNWKLVFDATSPASKLTQAQVDAYPQDATAADPIAKISDIPSVAIALDQQQDIAKQQYVVAPNFPFGIVLFQGKVDENTIARTVPLQDYFPCTPENDGRFLAFRVRSDSRIPLDLTCSADLTIQDSGQALKIYPGQFYVFRVDYPTRTYERVWSNVSGSPTSFDPFDLTGEQMNEVMALTYADNQAVGEDGQELVGVPAWSKPGMKFYAKANGLTQHYYCARGNYIPGTESGRGPVWHQVIIGGNTFDPNEVSVSKALQVINDYASNGGPFVEPDESFYERQFTDDYTSPGDEFLYQCTPSRPVSQGEPTIWKWRRYLEAGV